MNTSDMNRPRSNPAGAGFTLVELMLGLAVLALIGGAIAGLAGAASSSWHATESSAQLQTGARQSTAQLARLIREARLVGLATVDGQVVVGDATAAPTDVSPGATLMLWQDVAGQPMVLGKVTMVQHDLRAGTLVLCSVRPGTAAAAQPCGASDINDSVDAEMFRSLPDVRRDVIARHVSSAKFIHRPAANSQSLPLVEILLTYRDGDFVQTEYRTLTLRMASAGGN
jgi:prepilin-type N-terminal cleavage/methylation domain-containing protein